MGETVTNFRQPFRKLTLIIPTLLLAAIVAGGTALYTTHAAAPNPLTGRYALRAITTSGPQAGLYITGALSITVGSTGSISGFACGMSYAHSSCLAVSGNTPDNVNVTLTIVKSKNPSFPALSLIGTFHSSSGLKGGYTGFIGTFSFTNRTALSGGSWQGINGAVPPSTSSWKLHMLVNSGHDKGKVYDGILSIVEDPLTSAITGTYTPIHGTALIVHGSNQNGSVLLTIGKPAQFILKGTFTKSSGAGRMNGQFYIPGSGTGPQNDRGYWVANL